MMIETNDNLATRLRRLMHHQGNLTEAELARATQLPQPTIHRLISGDTLDPRVSTLQVLATHFNVPLDYLLAKSPLLPQSELNLIRPNSHHLFPIVAWEDVIGFIQNRAKLMEKYNNQGDWTSTDLPLTENAFVLQSRPSMEPRFSRGTLIFIEPSFVGKDGDLVLVEYTTEKQLALRSLFIDGGTKVLQSLANSAVTEPFDKHKKIVGVVMQSKYTFHQDL